MFLLPLVFFFFFSPKFKGTRIMEPEVTLVKTLWSSLLISEMSRLRPREESLFKEWLEDPGPGQLS